MKEDGRADIVRLADIQAALKRIIAYTKGGREAFLESTQIQDAVVRNLEVVGEAAGKVSVSVRSENPRVEWQELRGLASFAKHEHWKVDIARLWAAVEEVPAIERNVATIRADRLPRRYSSRNE